MASRKPPRGAGMRNLEFNTPGRFSHTVQRHKWQQDKNWQEDEKGSYSITIAGLNGNAPEALGCTLSPAV
jgi:hypothetical protein